LEIVLRFYLTIGATALAILLALAATSTDGMVRRLGGRRWQTLHRFVYAAATLATIHFFLQSKIDVSEPTLMAGFFLWLMGYRVISWYGGRSLATSRRSLALLGVGCGVLTILGEVAYFGLFTGVEASRVLQANLSLAAGPRPGWIVFATGLAIAAMAVASTILSKPVSRPSRR
jgi:sulfoxide reductase heme-binding subunit YedZ